MYDYYAMWQYEPTNGMEDASDTTNTGYQYPEPARNTLIHFLNDIFERRSACKGRPACISDSTAVKNEFDSLKSEIPAYLHTVFSKYPSTWRLHLRDYPLPQMDGLEGEVLAEVRQGLRNAYVSTVANTNYMNATRERFDAILAETRNPSGKPLPAEPQPPSDRDYSPAIEALESLVDKCGISGFVPFGLGLCAIATKIVLPHVYDSPGWIIGSLLGSGIGGIVCSAYVEQAKMNKEEEYARAQATWATDRATWLTGAEAHVRNALLAKSDSALDTFAATLLPYEKQAQQAAKPARLKYGA